MIWTGIRDVLLVLAAAPFAYYFAAILAGSAFFRKERSDSQDFTPPVSILRPICGLDRETYQNYESFCRQDYPEFEMLFCVSDENDLAIPTIQKLIGDFPQRSIRLLIGSEPLGESDKVNKLCRMTREARYDLVIVSDSDVRVEPGFLRAVVAPFSNPEVGGVTCLYRGITDGSLPADIEALGNSTDFAPGVLVAWLFGGLTFMLGAVMATTKKHLAEIGGFESLVDYFCDDYELGNRIAARGYRIELSQLPVAVDYPHEAFGGAFRHQVRWNLSIRASRPLGHLGLIFTQALPWAVVVGALVSPRSAIGYFAAAFLFRNAVATSVGFVGMKDRLVLRRLWLLLFRDVFAFLAWAASFIPQRIHWRGQEFYVRKRLLVPVATRHLGTSGTMTTSRKGPLLAKFNGNPPAEVAAIRRAEADSGLDLPHDYKEFLLQMNGGEGFIGNMYAVLWRAEELADLNKNYHVYEYAPGLFLFGSNGGGEAFAFDISSNPKWIVSVPFVGMELKEAHPMASSFHEFLQELFKS